MIAALKRILSKRAIVIVLAILLVITGFNTYLILGTRPSNPINYDYVLSQNGNNYKFRRHDGQAENEPE